VPSARNGPGDATAADDVTGRPTRRVCPARSARSGRGRSGARRAGASASSVTFQPSCTTASTAWYRCSMTDSSTSTGPPLDRDGRCQASAGATVKHQPNTVSRISRTRVKHQVTPERPASPGTRQPVVGPRGFEPRTCGLRVRSIGAGQSALMPPEQAICTATLPIASRCFPFLHGMRRDDTRSRVVMATSRR